MDIDDKIHQNFLRLDKRSENAVSIIIQEMGVTINQANTFLDDWEAYKEYKNNGK